MLFSSEYRIWTFNFCQKVLRVQCQTFSSPSEAPSVSDATVSEPHLHIPPCPNLSRLRLGMFFFLRPAPSYLPPSTCKTPLQVSCFAASTINPQNLAIVNTSSIRPDIADPRAIIIAWRFPTMMFPPPGPSMTHREKAVVPCKPTASEELARTFELDRLTTDQDGKGEMATTKNAPRNPEIVAIKVRSGVANSRSAHASFDAWYRRLLMILTISQTTKGKCEFELQEPLQESPPKTPTSDANYVTEGASVLASATSPWSSPGGSSNAATWEDMFTTPPSSAVEGFNSAKTYSNASAVVDMPQLFRQVEEQEQQWHRELALAKLERASLPKVPLGRLSPMFAGRSPAKLATAPMVSVLKPVSPAKVTEKPVGGKNSFEGLKSRLRGKRSKAQLQTAPSVVAETLPKLPSTTTLDVERILASPDYPEELKYAAASINDTLKNARRSQDAEGVKKLEDMSENLVIVLRQFLFLKEQKDIANDAADRAQARYDDCVEVIIQLTKMIHCEANTLPFLLRKHSSG